LILIILKVCDLTALLNLGSTFSSGIRIHQGPYIYW